MAPFAGHYRVLRYDSRGHGASAVPAGAYSMDRLGRDMVELLDALELQTVSFCGLSLGGMVGQWLGIRAPERVRRLILANTSAYMGPPRNWDARIEAVSREGMSAIAEASIARWFTPDFPAIWPKVVLPIREALLATDPTGYAGCCAAIRDMDMRRTGTLNQVPALILAGSHDPATPAADSEALAATLGHARIKFLEAAHLSNCERPEEFTAACLDFLR